MSDSNIPDVRVPNRAPDAATNTAAEFSDEEVARIQALSRAPRKWADSDRTEVTPEWRVWHEGRKNRLEEDKRTFLRSGFGSAGGGWANEAIYFPDEYDRVLDEEGDWILVIDPPRNVALDFDVPLLSMWFARPHVLNSGRFGDRSPYQAIIQTPAGDLHLWPHEYTIVSDPVGLIGEPGANILTLGGEPLLDPEHVFYLRSRGIDMAEVVKMLFTQIRQPNYAYVTFPDEAIEVFAGVGTRPGSTARQDYLAGRNA